MLNSGSDYSNKTKTLVDEPYNWRGSNHQLLGVDKCSWAIVVDEIYHIPLQQQVYFADSIVIKASFPWAPQLHMVVVQSPIHLYLCVCSQLRKRCFWATYNWHISQIESGYFMVGEWCPSHIYFLFFPQDIAVKCSMLVKHMSMATLKNI